MSAGYEVRVTPHVSGNTYNVDLVSWDRRGNGMVCVAREMRGNLHFETRTHDSSSSSSFTSSENIQSE